MYPPGRIRNSRHKGDSVGGIVSIGNAIFSNLVSGNLIK
jgi:hypothetical protein